MHLQPAAPPEVRFNEQQKAGAPAQKVKRKTNPLFFDNLLELKFHTLGCAAVYLLAAMV